MKKLILLITLFLVTHLVAQDNYPKVETTTFKDKLFRGKIDTFPITMYLKFSQFSDNHFGVYSVEGWYYYDKVKSKIPLSGIYDQSELIIYNFNDSSQQKELLGFLKAKGNHWEEMEYYKNLEGYNEKFIFSENRNYWVNGKKELEVELNTNDLAILKVNEYLLLDATNSFDLHNLGNRDWGFKLLAQQKGKFILQYEYGSRLYVMGRCGSGVEKGFMTLSFDENNKLIQYKQFVIESCNSSISVKKMKEVTNKLTVYECENYTNDKSFTLTVDLNTISVEKKEQH